MPINAEVRGIKEVSAKMEQVVSDLHGRPFLQGMRDATLIVMRDARIFAPVDTGRLRASIAPEVRTEGKTVLGVVGSNVKYAPYQELGFRPHFVPAQYIGVWASRHGFGYTGLPVSGKAKRFLQRAFVQNKGKIVKLLAQAVTRISNK